MAYNLNSLVTVLQKILDPKQTYWIFDHNKPQLQFLLEKATSLKKILENCSTTNLKGLESQIRDAAHEAEYTIKSHIADQILLRPGLAKYNFSTPNLHQIVQDLDSAMEQVTKLMDGKKTISSASTSSFSPDSSSRSVVVGLDRDLLQLKDRLAGTQGKLQIIPIVGMGGIGKTTLARNLYNDPLIISHFTTCAWVTISQDYNVRGILLGLLGCIYGKLSDELTKKKDHELKHSLYQELYGRRYLIVLDDMWDTNFWNDIRIYFPDTNNASRIVLTTRGSDVAKHVDPQSPQHEVQLLNKLESWNLLYQKVFGEEDCPIVLQEIGRKIANDCGGLPLAIHVIGGLLSKVKKTKDVWENISNDVRAAIAKIDEKFSNILSLSYNYMPNHLKPCFLYVGVLPEDHEIKSSKLMQLWVSDGIIKSNGDKSLAEEAKDYLKALIERNLILVTRKKSNGKPKSVGMHDLMRDLCLRSDIFQSIPNIKKAGIRRYSSSVLDFLGFPSSLKKLNLRGCEISQRLLTTLCALRNLQALKIFRCKFIREEINEAKDEEWVVKEEDVLGSLQFLLLESLNLVRWTAVETNFPGLRRLIIRDCSALEEIPSGIGEIMTLQLIELEKCSPTAVESAKEIREVQYDYGNYELQLRIIS